MDESQPVEMSHQEGFSLGELPPQAEPMDSTVRVLKQGGFVVLVLGGKGHRLLKRDARKLGGLLQKAGLS